MLLGKPAVLIVGAGPCGLVLAVSLIQNGIPVRIIDKNKTYHLGRRGATIMPRTQEVYNLLGVLSDIQQQGFVGLQPIRKYDSLGASEIIDMSPMQTPTSSVPWPNGMFLGQQISEHILRSHLAELGCSVELGTELVLFKQSGNHVEARLIKHADEDTEESITVPWLVGADGARGVVRKQLGLTFPGEVRDEKFVVGDIRLTGLSKDIQNWHMWGDISSALITLIPAEQPDDVFSFFILGHKVDNAKLAANHDELKRFIYATTNRPDLGLGEIIWVSNYQPQIRMVNKFSEGRVFVAGDAAHIHSPAGGQGMNTGVQDAFNLAWKLALVIKNLALPSLLSTYNEERLPVIAEMLNQSTGLHKRMFSIGSNPTLWRRNRILDQLGVNYRWSSIVIDEQNTGDARMEKEIDSYGVVGNGIRAGDRPPNAPDLIDFSLPRSEGPTSLFQIFGSTYHTVMVFCSSAAAVDAFLTPVRRLPKECVRPVVILPKGVSLAGYGDIVVEDSEGHAYQNYAIKGDSTVVVRPDGVIGAIVCDSKGVEAYFNGIFRV